MPAVRKPPASCLARAGGFVWDVAAGSIAWSDNAGAVFTDIPLETLASATEFARLIEPALDPVGRARPDAAGAQRRGGCVPDRYGVRTSTSAPVIWIEETGRSVCGARRQAGARARHRPHR